MEKLRRQIQVEQKPPATIDDSRLTREQQRALKKNEIYQEMARRKIEKDQEIFKKTGGKPIDECPEAIQREIMRLENLYAAADERDLEELSKFL